MQGVFSIPLGNGSTRPGAAARERTRPTSLGEFIAGPENRLAAVAVKAVLEQTALGLSPLVLIGPIGAGKTHLARGLAEWWERHHPADRVTVLTGAEWAQQYADAVESDSVATWRVRLRSADLLVIDDLTGLMSKRGAQQELSATLDELGDRHGTVLVTAATLPSEMQGLSESLRSRLSAGLSVPVNLPAPATRRVIIGRFAELRGMELSRRSAHAIADGLNVSTPQLLGALMELDLAAKTQGKPLDQEYIQHYLTTRNATSAVSVRDIAAVTARYFSLKLADLKSPSRRKAIVSARNIAVFLARQLTNRSLEQIGEYFGGRDHTTVLHGYRRIEKLAKSDPATRLAITELKQQVALA